VRRVSWSLRREGKFVVNWDQYTGKSRGKP